MKRRSFIASAVAGVAGLLGTKRTPKVEATRLARSTVRHPSVRMQAMLDYNRCYLRVDDSGERMSVVSLNSGKVVTIVRGA
jgi:hypothetical protein